MSDTSDFKEIVFNERSILVSKKGIIKYPERIYVHEVGGRRYIKNKSKQVLKQTPAGYKKKYLGINVKNLETGKQKMLLIHRAIALAFIPNPDDLPQIHHINGNQRDNRIENLEWVDNHTNSQEYTTRRPKAGYHIHRKTGLYQSKINIYSTSHSLGYLETAKEAQQCYFDTYKEWWGVEPFLKPDLTSSIPDQ